MKAQVSAKDFNSCSTVPSKIPPWSESKDFCTDEPVNKWAGIFKQRPTPQACYWQICRSQRWWGLSISYRSCDSWSHHMITNKLFWNLNFELWTFHILLCHNWTSWIYGAARQLHLLYSPLPPPSACSSLLYEWKNTHPTLYVQNIFHCRCDWFHSRQGKHFRLICDSKLYCGRCIKELETKSGVCGCCNVLNQRWLIVFRISLFYNLAMKLFLGLSSRGASRHCTCII